MAPQWPATVTNREVVSVNKTDRSDGYDWTAHLRFTHSNGVAGNRNLSGGISHQGRFTEWLTERRSRRSAASSRRPTDSPSGNPPKPAPESPPEEE